MKCPENVGMLFEIALQDSWAFACDRKRYVRPCFHVSVFEQAVFLERILFVVFLLSCFNGKGTCWLALELARPSPSIPPDDEKQKRCVLQPTVVGTKRNSAMLKGAGEVCKSSWHVVRNNVARRSHAFGQDRMHYVRPLVHASMADIQSVLE